jgi:NADH dehydrogenase FAD-containing subunit
MDFINHDAFRYFGDCARYAQVTLVEMQPKVLASFSQKASLFALKTLKEANVNVLLSTRVTKVDSSVTFLFCFENTSSKNCQHGPLYNCQSITIESGTTVKTIPCNFVLWASGVAPVSFTQELIKKYDLKKNRYISVFKN